MIKAVIFDYGGVINIHLRLNRSVLEFARDLKQKGYTTAILSNMISPISWFVERRGDLEQFAPVVVSSQVGCSKPDVKIYQIVLERLKLPPEQCIFIDNHERNLIPARQMGIQTVLAQNPEQVIADVSKLLGINYQAATSKSQQFQRSPLE